MKSVVIVVSVILISAAWLFPEPVLEIYPEPLKFGYISVEGSQTRQLTMVNVGDQMLAFDSCQCPPPFAVDPVSGITIGPGDTLIMAARFIPESESSYDETINFYYNAASPYLLPVQGVGVRNFQPGEIIWAFQHIENVECVLAADDYNGDGLPDVVAEGYGTFAGDGDPLVCLSGSGLYTPETIWSVHPAGGPSNSGGWGDKCLSLSADVNGDGFKDVLRGSAWGGRSVYAIDGSDGSTIWCYDTYQNPPGGDSSGWVYSVEPISDLNGDGIPEVIAGMGSPGDRAVCLDGATGSRRWTYRTQDAVSKVAPLQDINGDGYEDVAIGVTDYGTVIQVVSGASMGNASPIWMFNLGYGVFSLCTIKDINDDTYDDVIAGTWGRGVMAFSGHRAGQGVVLWEYPLNTSVMKVVSCPDLNGDSYDDVLVASWSSYAVALSGVDGSEIWRFFCGDDVWAIYYVNDITGDGVPEVIAGSFTHNVDLIDGALGTRVWQTPVGAKPFSVRNIGDVNGDTYEDVIVGTQYLNSAGGQVFVLSGWRAEGVGIDEEISQLPQDFIVASNYPNPFNSSTIIKFNLPKAGPYEVSIYNAIGQVIDRINGQGRAGANNMVWDLADKPDMASGAYFYKIESGGLTGQSRMLYLK